MRLDKITKGTSIITLSRLRFKPVTDLVYDVAGGVGKLFGIDQDPPSGTEDMPTYESLAPSENPTQTADPISTGEGSNISEKRVANAVAKKWDEPTLGKKSLLGRVG